MRLNRAVALAEVRGAPAAVAQIEALAPQGLDDFLPYHAVRADVLRKAAGMTKRATPMTRHWRWSEHRQSGSGCNAKGRC
ncbi:MAG TPA: hypothetical protein VJQ52_23320 [Steroidobacteraceae bacterium]|nr:hypothetical protein [Steroidobacteraceae bacterium]